MIKPPDGYSTRYERLLEELHYPMCCKFCNGEFTSNEVGTLACSFHPMTYYGRATRAIPYAEVERDDVCTVCMQYQVPAVFSQRIPEAMKLRRYDCTRIDHTSDPDALFRNFIIGVPTFFAEYVKINFTSSGNPSVLPNVLLVDKPEIIQMLVVYNVPGLGLYTKPVVEIYEEITERFGLCNLDEALKEATKQVKQTISFSDKAGMTVKGAEKIRTLYVSNRDYMEFVPFYIIARVQQSPGDMKFIPE